MDKLFEDSFKKAHAGKMAQAVAAKLSKTYDEAMLETMPINPEASERVMFHIDMIRIALISAVANKEKWVKFVQSISPVNMKEIEAEIVSRIAGAGPFDVPISIKIYLSDVINNLAKKAGIDDYQESLDAMRKNTNSLINDLKDLLSKSPSSRKTSEFSSHSRESFGSMLGGLEKLFDNLGSDCEECPDKDDCPDYDGPDRIKNIIDINISKGSLPN